MSDLADKAGEAIAARGGSFAGPRTDGRACSRELPKCSCGGKAGYRPHPPLRSGGPSMETLACIRCGNSVGPFSARSALASAWRLGGCETPNV